MFVGLDMFRALRYKPQALQMVEPVGDRRQSGVCVVPQLLDLPISNLGFGLHFRVSADEGRWAYLHTCPIATGILIGAYFSSG